MTNKKSKLGNILIDSAVIAFCVVIFCTLVMKIFTATGSISGTTTVSSVSTIDFFGSIFKGDTTNGWAIATLVLYILVLLLTLVVTVLAVLRICGVKFKKLPKKTFEILLTIFTIIFVVAAVMYTSASKGVLTWGNTTLASATMSISWASFICPISSICILVFECLER